MKRTIATIVLAGMLALPALAATRFPDVPSDHPRSADIQFVAAQSPAWFGGYPDGSFKPERVITAAQMATVIGRAFPEGMTRAEFASFLRGGAARVATTPAATTTVPAAPAVEQWAERDVFSCSGLYAEMVADAEDKWDYNPDEYDPYRDTEGTARYGSYLSVDILRVIDWRNRFVTASVFMCEGEAKLDNGRKLKMFIWVLEDADGDIFTNYRYPSANRPSCAAAKSAGHNVLSYNANWYYGASNDADGDGVMCEDALPEDELVPVGDPAGPGV